MGNQYVSIFADPVLICNNPDDAQRHPLGHAKPRPESDDRLWGWPCPVHRKDKTDDVKRHEAWHEWVTKFTKSGDPLDLHQALVYVTDMNPPDAPR
jgi:hypothetical protein